MITVMINNFDDCIIKIYLMAKIVHYLPELNNKFICHKGGLHAEESLNIVCLDPLCRNDPLGCSICFSNTHKYHKVVSVDKFVDDYSKNVKQVNQSKNLKKIEKHHLVVKKLIGSLREDINKKLDDFESSINEYADELRSKTAIRQNISKIMKIQLQPNRLKNTKSNQQFIDFLKFVLNNSLFDKNNNMIRVADVLKQDQERIYALLDKMVNMTQMCQDYIKEVMESLNFSDQTLKEEKNQFKQVLNKLNTKKDSFDTSQFNSTQLFHKTLAKTNIEQKTYWRKQLVATQAQKDTNKEIEQAVKFTFHPLKKHQMIEIKQKYKVGVSNISALKPQYALLTPHLATRPSEVKQWSIKINNCRNFASQNTMGVGLATEQDLQNTNFEGVYPKSILMLTSQGYVIQNGQSRKTNVIFGAGDTLHFKYDPFYELLEIQKQNGRKIALKVDNTQEKQMFACVRLTYASDQVQIL